MSLSPLSPSHEVIRFGDFDVDPRAGELRKHGIRIRLQVQPFQVLQTLLEHPGEVVTREELQKRIWPADTFVDFDQGLNNAVKKLREALGDDAEKPRFVETLSKRGYRFIAPVEENSNGGRAEAAPAANFTAEPVNVPADRGTARRAALVAGTVLAFSALIILGFKIADPRPSSKRSTEVSPGKAGYVPSFTQTNYDVGSQPDSVVVGDFNNDSKLDLAVANAGDGTVSILLGKGDGTFQSPTQYPVGPAGLMSQIAAGDFNGDGHLDLVVSNFDGHNVSVLLGNGDGTFRAAGSYNVGTNPTSVAVVDLNRDGKLDLVVSNQNCNNAQGPCGPGTVSVLLGNGDGTFQAHRDFSTCKGANWVAVGDFNGDGKPDLAVACGASRESKSKLSILLGNGDGTFLASVSYELASNADSVVAADFNGDGKLDLALADHMGLVSILLGNGNGTFRPRVDYPIGWQPWGSIGIGDFNGDGNLDLAVATTTDPNLVTILTGKGDGTFLSLGAGSLTGLSPNGVAVGDFRRNGKLDLAVPVRSSNVVSILLQ